ncbi:ATP-binding protein [Desulfosarcina ovata]|uniref:ATP-binding protein n=1 Tax=Desulfosarcina ovata TaxID=83564 RepID=UPI0015653370|nr:ATP-binding protein [Desulfosarcina ovata]
MTYKTVNNICLCLLLLLVAVLGFVPTLNFDAMSEHNNDQAADIQAMRIVYGIYEDFEQTAVAFDRYVRHSVGDADTIVQNINSNLEQASRLKERVSGTDKNSEMAENLVRNLHAFKSAVFNYHQERMYDPTGDGLFQLEQLSLHIKSNLAKCLESYMQAGLRDIEKRNFDLLVLIRIFSKFSIAGFIFGVIICLLIAVFLGRSFSRPMNRIIEGAQILGAGNLEHRITLRSFKEFNHLADEFNSMSNHLKNALVQEKKLGAELSSKNKVLQARNDEIKAALMELKNAQARLLQSEKMASIGQLAAGVAHEINNPIAFVKSNLSTINEYLGELMDLVVAYESMRQRADEHLDIRTELADEIRSVAATREDIDMDFIQEDIDIVLQETMEGIDRVANIVADLKNFAHMDSDRLEWASVNEVIDSTLNVVWNELKYKTEVVKDLSQVPRIQCYPQRLGQAIMNLLINAGQAIEKKGTVRIMTRAEGDHVKICISDTGCGIPEEHLKKIYDPFFTTKDVGQGTGLGLNIVYNIVKKHQGIVEVESAPAQGTTFTLTMPIELQPEEPH